MSISKQLPASKAVVVPLSTSNVSAAMTSACLAIAPDRSTAVQKHKKMDNVNNVIRKYREKQIQIHRNTQ